MLGFTLPFINKYRYLTCTFLQPPLTEVTRQNPDIPPPLPTSMPPQSVSRPRVYSKLPGFPEVCDNSLK